MTRQPGRDMFDPLQSRRRAVAVAPKVRTVS